MLPQKEGEQRPVQRGEQILLDHRPPHHLYQIEIHPWDRAPIHLELYLRVKAQATVVPVVRTVTTLHLKLQIQRAVTALYLKLQFQ